MKELLISAATRLYLYAKWVDASGDLTADEQAEMWEALRDALGLAPGTATIHGVGMKNFSPNE